MTRSKNLAVAAELDKACLAALSGLPSLAIGVSGGADSMALAHMLRAAFPDKPLFAYTVDHGLRAGSALEAAQVAQWLGAAFTHRILTWSGPKPESAIQDTARQARYDLLRAACAADNVAALVMAHHVDDQAETVLHRLAKGSGIDGLGGMYVSKSLGGGLTLWRPLLQTNHDSLVNYCIRHDIKWVEDPSNTNMSFARARLRGSRSVLEAEGLTNARLARLAQRMQRASQALDFYTDEAFIKYVDQNTIHPEARKLPAEIYLRLVLRLTNKVNPTNKLSSKLERLESLLERVGPFKATLGGMIIARDAKGEMTVKRENCF